MWSSTVGLINGKHRYLTAETFGFKISSNGQQLKRRQQWTIEPFPENTGPDGSISSAASVSSQCGGGGQARALSTANQLHYAGSALDAGGTTHSPSPATAPAQDATTAGYILTLAANQLRSSNGSTYSNQSDQDTCGEEHENVAIKSHLNKYLAVDSFGNVTCDSDEKTENARFTITICSMSQGRSKEEHIFWAFKNIERGYYLGTTDDGMICCNAKMPKSRAELWHLHLLPARGASFFAIKSLGRKRYARVLEDESWHASGGGGGGGGEPSLQVQLDANISWGAATLFQFKYHEGGRYSLLTSDDQLLTNEGRCLPSRPRPADSDAGGPPPAECLFTLEYHSGCLAFRDSFGQYLAAAGRSSVLRSRSIGVSRDELFVFESVPIQVSLKATLNNRWVSIKQGVDLSANQTEVTSKFETFQLIHQRQTQNWSIMTHDCNYWTVMPNCSTVSVCRPGDYEGLTRGQFRLVWTDDANSFKLKFVDINQCERWVSARKSGQLFLASGGPTQAEPVKFVMRFQSRRLLNLRPLDASGFLGLKAAPGGKGYQLEANKTAPEPIEIEYSDTPASANVAAADVKPVPEQTASDLNRATGNQLFNVRLTRHNHQEHDQQQQQQHEAYKLDADCEQFIEGIDPNNNICLDAYEKPAANGSGVETSSAPSVAAIINSFSSAKINGGAGSQQQQQQQQPAGEQKWPADGRPMSSAVSKLASTFESARSTGNSPPADGSDSSSVLTLCSSVSGYSSSSAANGAGQLSHETPTAFAHADQAAQGDTCRLKIRATGKYLSVDEAISNESNIKCDSASRKDAQTWTLELRSHNSVAIRASDTQAYMQLGTNGVVSLSRCRPEEATLWEF